MLQIVRNNNPLTVIILFIYALVINWQVLFHPQMPVVPDGDFLFHIIAGFAKVLVFNSAFGVTLIAVLMIALQGLYLNAIANRQKLFNKNTYIVAFVYISICSIYPSFTAFRPPLLVNWILIMVFDIILQLAQTQKPRKMVYNAGFLIGIAGLLMFPAIGYIVVFLFSLSILRNFNPGEWIVALLGLVTPLYFTAGLLFLFDVLHWLPAWVDVGINLPGKLERPGYTILMVVGLVTLFIFGTVMLQQRIVKINIFIRRGWTSIAISMIFSVFIALFTDFDFKAAWLITMPALSLVISNALYAEKNRAFSNFAFYFTLLLVIFCKMAGG